MRTETIVDVLGFLLQMSDTSFFKLGPEESGDLKARAFCLYAALRADLVVNCPTIKLDKE